MAVVSWHLARAAIVDPVTIAIALGAFVALAVLRVNSVWLVAAGLRVPLWLSWKDRASVALCLCGCPGEIEPLWLP